MTEYIASSRWVGSRPSSSTTAASSSSVMPSWRCSGRSIATETSNRLSRRTDRPPCRTARPDNATTAERRARIRSAISRKCQDPDLTSERWPPEPRKRRCRTTHKEALAEGRNHARIVGRYLEALEANKPKRGPQAHGRLGEEAAGHRGRRAQGSERRSTGSTCCKSGATSRSSWRRCRPARPISAAWRRNS